MDGVNNMDKDKKLGDLFTILATFRKWYRIGLVGVLIVCLSMEYKHRTWLPQLLKINFNLTTLNFVGNWLKRCLDFEMSLPLFFHKQQFSNKKQMVNASGPHHLRKSRLFVLHANLSINFGRLQILEPKKRIIFYKVYCGLNQESCTIHCHSVQTKNNNVICKMTQFEGMCALRLCIILLLLVCGSQIQNTRLINIKRKGCKKE